MGSTKNRGGLVPPFTKAGERETIKAGKYIYREQLRPRHFLRRFKKKRSNAQGGGDKKGITSLQKVLFSYLS